jgi:ABC-2 type transport system permease protein
VVDEAKSPASTRLLAALGEDPSLELVTRDSGGRAIDAAGAREMVASGALSVAIVISPSFDAALLDPARGVDAATVLADISDPVAPQMVGGLLQAAILRTLPDLLLRRSLLTLEGSAGVVLSEQQWDLLASSAQAAGVETATPAPREGLVPVAFIDVVGGQRKNPAIAFYAASTAVLFLLFTVSAAAGTLLDEEELGVLERLLTSNLTMGRLLVGRWLFNSLRGVVQVTLMFLWGALIFKLDLWTPNHLAGFVIMTLATASSASAFGLVLATLCRTRAQLNGISTIVVLTMSALGGSMFPRYLMPDWMQDVGLITFNAWALDGYRKVFWYDAPPFALWPQVLVLLGLGIGCLIAARRLARRWEVT